MGVKVAPLLFGSTHMKLCPLFLALQYRLLDQNLDKTCTRQYGSYKDCILCTSCRKDYSSHFQQSISIVHAIVDQERVPNADRYDSYRCPYLVSIISGIVP